MAMAATRLLLERRTKGEVCRFLSERFPSITGIVNVPLLLESSSVSLGTVQSEFWNAICEKISEGGEPILHEFVGQEYYDFCSRFEKVHHSWYKNKVNPFMLLADVVFFSDCTNRAFPHSERLQQLQTPLEHLYVRSLDLAEAPNDPQVLIEVARRCREEAEGLQQKFDDCTLFWHGTSGASAFGIVNRKEIRQSGSGLDKLGHDFGMGVYAFQNVLHALSFSINRAFLQRGNPALLCMCLPNKFLEGSIEVADFAKSVDQETLKGDVKLLDRDLELLGAFNGKDAYTAEKLDSWEFFVKFCWRLKRRPAHAVADVFTGDLHNRGTVLDTIACARPDRDKDGWRQWCFTSGNLLAEEDSRFFFFELDIPHLLTKFIEEECDEAITAAAVEED